MKTKVAKWGNSLALRLPKALTSSRKWEAGAELEIVEYDEGILLKPSASPISLEALVTSIRPGQLHGEVDTGEPRGNETW